MKKLMIPLMVLLLGILAVGCGTPVAPSPTEVAPAPAPTEAAPAATPTEAPPPEPEVEQVLRIGFGASYTSLDPYHTILVYDWAVIQHIYDALFRYDRATGELHPALCTEYEVSDDGLVYTFHLREGVQWHGGYGEFTANDVKFSIERHQDPDAESKFASEFELVDEVEVVDDYTVRVTLKQTYVPFLHAIAGRAGGWIVNQQAIEDFGEEYDRNPIGLGPFVFDHWTPRTEIVLLANPDYYGGPPTLEKLVFIPIPEAATAEMALQGGDIDVMEVTDPTAYQRFEADPNFTVKTSPSLMYCTIGIDNNREPFTDVRVRQALMYAINRQEIVDEVLAGVASLAHAPLPPAFLGYTEDVTQYEYNPDKALELLEEAGYPNGFETTVVYPPGAGYGYFDLAMIAAQEDLADVGIQMNIEKVDGATWWARLINQESPLTYLGTAKPPDPDMALTVWFDANSPSALTGYTETQDLLEAGRVELDPDARGAIYEDIMKKMAEDVPVVSFFHPQAIIAMQNYVKGMEVDLLRGFWSYDVSIEAH